MSIAAANLFTRNIYREYIKKDATHADEAQVSKIASLVVKLGAVAFIIFLDPQFSIDLQLIGGVIILQTAPSVALGLYTRWLHRGGLVRGLGGRHGDGPVDALQHRWGYGHRGSAPLQCAPRHGNAVRRRAPQP
jgi:SSS family solute:Na+ symporter